MSPLPSVWQLLSFLLPGLPMPRLEPRVPRGGSDDESIAEIDGGPLETDTSVFTHIEYGLFQNPHGAAVVSTHQLANHLADLVPADDLFAAQQPRFKCLAWSYRQIHVAALKLVTGLMANAVQPKSTILILIPNGGEFCLLLWTCVLMRLTYVCLDRSALDNGGSPELRDILRRPETSVVISDVASCPAVDAAIANLHLAKNPLRICLESKSTFNGWKSLLDLAADGSATQIAEEDLVAEARNDDPNRVHSILFTSGTSGRPKGCPLRVGGMSHMLTSQSWLINKHNCTLALQQAHNSRGIAPAQTLQTWRDGGAVVMTGRGFAVDGVVDVIKRYGVTFVVLTPPMVHALGQQLAPGGLDVDVSSVRSVQVGGDAVTKDVLMRCAAIFPNAQVCVNHGMTEGGGQFEWPFMDAPTRSIPFYGEICPIGRVARGAVVRIWDADRQRVAKRGRPGELHLCCGSIIPQYHRGESESTFYSDEKGRWFRTGDIAMMDDDGLVFILGRSKDMIKRMGLAIMPAPLESCMEKFTGAQTSVVPIPRQEGGYEPFSVLASLNCKTEEDIRNHVMRTLGAEYVLGGIVTLEQLGLSEFPVNPTHKIMKSELTDIVLSHLQAVTG